MGTVKRQITKYAFYILIFSIFLSVFSLNVYAEEVIVKYGTSLTLSRVPEESKIASDVIQYSLLAQTAAVTVAQASSSALSIPNLNYIEYFKYLFSFSIISRRKRRNNWGLVYDINTSKPIAFAVIRIYDAISDKLINTTVSDINGKYGIVLDTGKYYLKVEHQDYNFKDKENASSATLNDMNIYHGSVFDTNDTVAININLPLEPKLIKRKFSIQSFRRWWRNSKLAEITSDPYYIGFFFLLNLGLCIFSFNILYVILTIFYAFNLLVNIFIYLSKPARTWGRVLTSDEKPISNAFVKIYLENSDKLLDTIITDDKGRFQLFIEKGKYQVLTQAANYSFPSRLRYQDANRQNGNLMPLEIGDNGLNVDLYMDQITAYTIDQNVVNTKFGYIS